MKLLTKEEEDAHYSATIKGGLLGGATGLGLGFAGVLLAQRRYPAFNQLTLPLKAFLITSSGTFGGIVSADHAGRAYELSRNTTDQYFEQRRRQEEEAQRASMTFSERAMEWGRKERYKIVGGSWVLSMIASFAIVGRNPYLSGAQKLVQARVYAQGLTLAVLVASAAFEISEQNAEKQAEKEGRTLHHDDEDTRSQKDFWKDMVAAEEERLAERDRAIKEQEEKDKKEGKHHKKHPAQHPKAYEDEEGPEPIPGKKGEGKSMKHLTDKPDQSSVP